MQPKLNKYVVPYKLSYHNTTNYWEVFANNKQEAREKTVYDLSTDKDVTHIASVGYIIKIG